MPLDSQAIIPSAVIERGIPLPPASKAPYSSLDAIIGQMLVGDSVLPSRVGVKATAFMHWARRRKTGIKFAIRRTRDGDRVWRIA